MEISPKIRYPLAGEKHLPGSHGKDIPEYISFPRPGLPKAYSVRQGGMHTISEWATICREMIDNQLPKYGALLFRGLPLNNGNQFSSFVRELGLTPKGYEGGAGYRPSFDSDAVTFISTIVNKAHHIEPHNDMSYLPDFPKKVRKMFMIKIAIFTFNFASDFDQFCSCPRTCPCHCPCLILVSVSSQVFFYCDIPAGEGCGGLTPVTLGTEVLKNLDSNVVEKFEEKQVRYWHCLPTEGNGYLPWQVSFRTKDRKVHYGS